MEYVFTWRELVRALSFSTEGVDSTEISSLVTTARQKGVGFPVSYQKTKYSGDHIVIMNKIFMWWRFLVGHTMYEFRDRYTSRRLQQIIVNCVVEDRELIIYAIFCPSYRKGDGEVGYTGRCGKYTSHMIKNLSNFVYGSNQVGVRTRGKIYFSDLILENYSLLKNTNYRQDLDLNFRDFVDMFRNCDAEKLIDISRLSTEQSLSQIGERGLLEGNLNISDEIYKVVLKRNRVFYKNVLGWNDNQIKERTETLARCYVFMGNIFRELYPSGIMYWVESAYERGKMYNGMKQQEPLAIIYPQKIK